MAIAKVFAILTVWIAAALPVKASSQDVSAAPQKLMVATMAAPPFAMKTADGRWEGLSIELWQAIVEELGVEYELIEYSRIGQIMEAFEKGELDALPAMAVKASRENILDLSHAYLRSGSAIAVPAVISGHSLFYFTGHFVDRFVSLEFLLLIGLLVLLSFAAGAMVWLFEGRRNREMFGGGLLKGLGQGLWWAMVTMTTVGYGDKAPKTIGGRIVALVWMFVSIILVASFTAAITVSLTVGELSGKVRGLHDLYGVRVGAVDQSEVLNFLAQRGIAGLPFENEKMGLQAMVDKKIDAFVYNEFILKYLAKTEFSGQVHVLFDTFNHYYVGIAMPQGSPLREPVNRALLKIMDTADWLSLMERYVGPEG